MQKLVRLSEHSYFNKTEKFMPTALWLCVIEAKRFTVFMDIFPNHLACAHCFKHGCNFKSPFEGEADVGFTKFAGKGSWPKVVKMFSTHNDNVTIFC